MNDAQFQQVCDYFNIGTHQSHARTPKGFSHHVYHVHTSKGEFAIKKILDEGMDYEIWERVSAAFADHGVNAVSGIKGDGGKGDRLYTCDFGRFLAHNWVSGEIIEDAKAKDIHLEAIGALLASMCKLNLQVDGFDYSSHPLSNEELAERIEKYKQHINSYALLATNHKAPFASLFHSQSSMLCLLHELSEQNVNNALKSNIVLCHKDLNSGNIIWQGATPYLIDWEGINPSNREVIIMQAAYLWTMNNLTSLPTLLNGYLRAGGELEIEKARCAISWLYGNEVRWMMHNVERYCNPNTSSEDKDQCASTVIDVIGNIEKVLPEFQKHFEAFVASKKVEKQVANIH